jgi:hypothetical protein
MKSLPQGSQNTEMKIEEINARSHEFNPAVQGILGMIGGLMLLLIV